MCATESPTAGVGASDRSTPRRLGRHQLTHPGDLERGALDRVRHRRQIAVAHLGERGAHHTRAGHPDVDDGIRLAGAVERARHKRVVFGSVAENDELRRADAVVILCEFRAFADDRAHFGDGIHIDARFG